jgi:iron complex outermembrane receptor protein
MLAADGAATDPAATPLGVVEVVGASAAPLPAGADVVSFDTIRTFDRRNVAEALDLLPGVSRQNVGQRRDTLINLRGFDSREVTLYFDGVPVYVPYDGNLDLARFGVEDLSQIVVTKGLTSVLYGPNALGGSINLVSRRPQAPFEGCVYAGFDVDRSGELPAYRAGGRVGTNQGTWYAQATASWEDADYYVLPSGYPYSKNQPNRQRANSASRDLNLSAKIGWTPNATDEYAFGVYRVHDDKQTPPYAGSAAGVAARFWRWPYWDKDGAYLITRTRLGDSATLRVRAYYDTFQNELDSYDDATYTTMKRPYAFKSLYDDHTYGASADLEQPWSDSQITRVAVHAKQDFHRENDSVGAPWEYFKDRTFSAGIEHEWRPDARWTVTPGVSWNEQQGQRADNLVANNRIVPFAVHSDIAFNGQIAATLQMTDDLQIYGGISRKTRFPTIKDRYSYRLGTAIPNPLLKQEESDNVEIGVKGVAGALHYQAALFNGKLQDAIQAVTIAPTACTSPPCSQNQNVGDARNRGVELSGSYAVNADLTLQANYTYLDRTNVSQPTVRLTDTPREKLFVSLDYAFAPRWNAIVSADTESKRYTTSDAKRIAGGFTRVDAIVRGSMSDWFDLSFGVRNALDRLYAYQEGFPEPGRTFFCEIGKTF